MKYLSPVEIGWLAGIIDGEGTLYANAGLHAARISVGMTDEDTINKLLDITGVGCINTSQRGNYKRLYTWTVSNRNDVMHILASITPLLSNRRREKVAELAEIALTKVRSRKKTFCIRGHDKTAEDGTYKNGACKLCGRKYDMVRYR